MKIVYARIKNNIGLVDGLGREEVEIDLSKFSKGQIVMILGKNGSGKSSLLAELNPHFDKSNFIEGKASEKEIHIEANGSTYVIRHKMSEKGKVSSWIDKDDEPLNKNGGVRTFKDILNVELGFNQDFFKIGMIGADVDGFIEQSSTERKTFASKFIPDIEPYVQRHKSAKEQIRAIKKTMNLIASQIDEHGDIEELKTSKASVEDRIKSQKDSISELTDKIAKGIAELNVLWSQVPKSVNQTLTNTSKSEVIEMEAELDEVLNQREELLQSINHLVSSFDQIDEIIEKNKEELNTQTSAAKEIHVKMSASNTNMSNLENSMTKASSELKGKQTRLTQIEKDSENLTTLKSDQINTEKELSDLLEEFPALKNFTNPTQQFFDSFKQGVESNATALRNVITEYSGNPRFKDMVETNFGGAFDLSKIRFESDMICKRVDQLDRELNIAKLEIGELQNRVSNSEILKQRPSACRIDSCSFISNAMRYQGSDDKLVIVRQKVSDLDSEKSTISQKIKDLQDLERVITKFEEVRKSIMNNPTISKSPLYKEASTNQTAFIHFAFNRFDYSTYTRMGALEKLVGVTSRKESIDKDIANMSGSVALHDEIKQDIITIHDRLTEYRELYSKEESTIADLNSCYKGHEKAINAAQDNIARLTEVKNKISKIDVLTTDLDAKREESNKIDKVLAEAIPLDQSIGCLQADKDNMDGVLYTIEQELPELISKITQIEKHQKQLDEINKEYQDLETISKVCDPVRGYPLFLIKDFLGKPKNLTNELLNIAYKGQFNIDFRITDKDFFIPVSKSNGNNADDVMEVSSGQRSMVKTALCFALINTFLGRYNIPAIDELDAFLDDFNRRCFLEILKLQIKTLGIEQLFVISHNDEFFAEKDLGLILFEGHTAPTTSEDFMERVTIIDDFS